jgi:hypothetical protein
MRIKNTGSHQIVMASDGFPARCGFLIHEGGGMPQR